MEKRIEVERVREGALIYYRAMDKGRVVRLSLLPDHFTIIYDDPDEGKRGDIPGEAWATTAQRDIDELKHNLSCAIHDALAERSRLTASLERIAAIERRIQPTETGVGTLTDAHQRISALERITALEKSFVQEQTLRQHDTDKLIALGKKAHSHEPDFAYQPKPPAAKAQVREAAKETRDE